MSLDIIKRMDSWENKLCGETDNDMIFVYGYGENTISFSSFVGGKNIEVFRFNTKKEEGGRISYEPIPFENSLCFIKYKTTSNGVNLPDKLIKSIYKSISDSILRALSIHGKVFMNILKTFILTYPEDTKIRHRKRYKVSILPGVIEHSPVIDELEKLTIAVNENREILQNINDFLFAKKDFEILTNSVPS